MGGVRWRHGYGRARCPKDADVTLALHRARADLAAEASGPVGDLDDRAALRIAWPRRAAGHVSDNTGKDPREMFLTLGWSM